MDRIDEARQASQEALEKRLWELHGEWDGEGFDFLTGLEEWLSYAYGFRVIREARFHRVQESERKLRKIGPIVTELAEMLRT
jgi:hypothetical protein